MSKSSDLKSTRSYDVEIIGSMSGCNFLKRGRRGISHLVANEERVLIFSCPD